MTKKKGEKVTQRPSSFFVKHELHKLHGLLRQHQHNSLVLPSKKRAAIRAIRTKRSLIAL
jgi:hypothetical protein